MAALSEHSNVYNSALLILHRKGYQLWYDNRTEDYCAELDGWEFRAISPCSLLGLVAIFESKNPDTPTEYWWRESGQEIYGHLPNEPTRPYKPVGAR